MNHRIAFLLALGAIGGLGVSGAACSASSSDGGSGGDDSGVHDSSSGDGSVSHDGGSDTNTGNDTGGGDGGSPEAAGNCSAVNGPACDIVTQNCPSGKECVATQGRDGGFTTACNPTSVGQHIAKGEPCSTQSPNPCLAGLECFDGHCTPHCCKGDDSVCGMSSQGVAGSCDLNISSGGASNVDLFMVCTYSPTCKPFHIVPCMAGQACEIQDKLGSAKCVGLNGAGKKEGETCMYLNDCADGLMCLGVPGQPSTCKLLCLTPNSTPPFDAGTSLDAGTGGCGFNDGGVRETCSGGLDPNSFPSWLSFCK